jgi:hypothetical protein
MFDLFEDVYEYYYLVLLLQALCIFHSIRRGNEQKWIWIILFLSLIGCLVYIFSEIIKWQHLSAIKSTATHIINPGGLINELEKRFKFSATYANRITLADAYLNAGMYEKAIALYEETLQGVFQNNDHVMQQLIHAYFETDRFEEIVPLGARLTNTMNFSKSRTNLLYALALEKTGRWELVEKQYQAMNHRFSNFEARYHYGIFLLGQSRNEDASLVFFDMVEEWEQMSRSEKGQASVWINKAKIELGKLVK